MKKTIEHNTPSWNALYSANKWVRKKIVDEERHALGFLLKGKFPPQKKRVDITIHQFSPRPIDSDNVCGKIWLDSMKDVGILKNDSPKYVGWVKTKSEKGERRTIIEIL